MCFGKLGYTRSAVSKLSNRFVPVQKCHNEIKSTFIQHAFYQDNNECNALSYCLLLEIDQQRHKMKDIFILLYLSDILLYIIFVV